MLRIIQYPVNLYHNLETCIFSHSLVSLLIAWMWNYAFFNENSVDASLNVVSMVAQWAFHQTIEWRYKIPILSFLVQQKKYTLTLWIVFSIEGNWVMQTEQVNIVGQRSLTSRAADR